MKRVLFAITCLTCRARLNVHRESAIGEILTCPKCGSMVEVLPPAGWRSGAKSEAQSAQDTPGSEATNVAAGPAVAAKPTRQTPAEATDSGGNLAASVAGGDQVAQAAAPDAADTPAAPASTTPSGVAPPSPPPQPPGDIGQPAPVEPVAAEREPSEAWGASPVAVAPAELLWRKWVLLAATPVAGLVIGAAAWTFFFSGGPEPPPVPAPVVPEGPLPVVEGPAPEEPKQDEPQPVTAPLDPRWLPRGTRLLVSLRMSRLARRKGFDQAATVADPVWPVLRPLVGTFGLKLRAIRRLSWAATDLSPWPDVGLVVIELEEGQDAGVFQLVGEPAGVEIDGKPCRRLTKGDWVHPFVVLDELTLITGREQLLREVAERSEPALESLPVERLLKTMNPDAEIFAVLDLASAREAAWKLPVALMDVWPAGREAWHVVWEVPLGLGFSLHDGQAGISEVALVCEGETAAQGVHAALEELIPAAKTAINAQRESLAAKRRPDRIPAAVADQYELLLTGAETALATARAEVADQTVWLRVGLGEDPSGLFAAGMDSRPAIRDAWFDAALAADQKNHQQLLSGLDEYHRKHGHFPAGAGGGALLPPETRLSWIATMLPAYGREEWHEELDFHYSWNSVQNRPVTRRRLDAVINPALGPSTTEAGFPVTHYVGVAGVGPDAGSLPLGDPRAGVFGHNRATRREDITDGASHTIAVLGVTGNLGPWAAGGNATVRPLTKPPYVNGPDGFGSGQPGGMLAGMADGSVRFFRSDTDPIVLEQLATIGGGEQMTVASLATTRLPQPIPAQEVPSTKPDEVPEQPGPESAPQPSKPAPTSPTSAVGEAAEPTALGEVDVQARLADRIPQISFPGVPLVAATDLVAQLSTLRITLDLEGMDDLGVSLHEPVMVQVSDATVGEVLQAILADHGLAYVVENDQILVTCPEERWTALRTTSYTVSDLTGGELAAGVELAEMVEELVAPDSWRRAGGRGTIKPAGGKLEVVQIAPVHHQVLTFCEKLRSARAIPLRSRYDPQRFSLATRLDRAQAKLSQPITANFHEPAPLERIVSDLEASSEMKILINWMALGTSGVSPEPIGSLTADNQPLAEALDGLLRPMGLAYRVVDADTLEITTRSSILARLELEFYPLADLLAEGETAGSLMGRIKDQVAGATWSEAGGPGRMRFDEPSQHLLVLQSQPVQFEVQALIERWRAERQAGAQGQQ